MDDLKQRDLSHKRDHELTREERRELRRRFEEFLALMRGNRDSLAGEAVKRKQITPWRPSGQAKRY